jgi:hypothetical protein
MTTVSKVTVEELLKPRYRLVTDYPSIPAKVGDVISENSPAHLLNYLFRSIQTLDELDRFRDIFKKLEWWVDRSEHEIPEYLKYSDRYLHFYHLGHEHKVKVFKISKVKRGNYGLLVFDDKGIICHHGVDNFEPATESEYITYLNAQK